MDWKTAVLLWVLISVWLGWAVWIALRLIGKPKPPRPVEGITKEQAQRSLESLRAQREPVLMDRQRLYLKPDTPKREEYLRRNAELLVNYNERIAYFESILSRRKTSV